MNKVLKNLYIAAAAAAMVFALAGCNNGNHPGEPETVYVNGVTLNDPPAIVEAGKPTVLSYTVMPEDATDRTVTWDSSDETVASVTDGVFLGHKPGTVTITVTTVDGGYTDDCEITVIAAFTGGDDDRPTGISLNKTALILDILDNPTEKLIATVSGGSSSWHDLSWLSSDSSVAIVDDEGNFTALSPGTATITVKAVYGINIIEYCTVTVTYYFAITGLEDWDAGQVYILDSNWQFAAVSYDAPSFVTDGRITTYLAEFDDINNDNPWLPDPNEQYIFMLVLAKLDEDMEPTDIVYCFNTDSLSLPIKLTDLTSSLPAAGFTANLSDFQSSPWVFYYLMSRISGNEALVFVTDIPASMTGKVGIALLPPEDNIGTMMEAGYTGNNYGSVYEGMIAFEYLWNEGSYTPWDGTGSFMIGLAEDVEDPDSAVYLYNAGTPLVNNTISSSFNVLMSNTDRAINFNTYLHVLSFNDFEELLGVKYGDFSD